jgi:ABC-type multidrug transport system fused ATPase/permease subunit
VRGKTSAVPERRRAALAALSVLWATISARSRLVVAATVVLAMVGKILAVVVADRVVGGDVRDTTVVGTLAVVVFGAARILVSGARVDAQCDLNRALARALLECDVLAEPTPQPMRALFEPAQNARTVIIETLPELISSFMAALAVAPIVVATLPARALVVATIAVCVVMLVLLALSRLSARVQLRVWDASQKVLDQIAFAVEGRLELAARGAEDVAMRSVEDVIHAYRRTAKRSAWASATLGRLPLAAGLGAVVLSVILDAASREAVTAAVLKQALVLAACLPIVAGIVMRTNDLLRLWTTIGPVLEVLAAPRRPELGRKGAAPPMLPADVVVRDVSFRYDPRAPLTLRDLSFEWPGRAPLFVEGSNGAGKSTLLRVLLGLRPPDEGSIAVAGAELGSLDLPQLRRSIAYLPQRPYLGEHHSTLRSALRGVADEAVSDDAMKSALERVGLAGVARTGDLLDSAVGELSAGQRQRLALARVLLQDAAIYLLDEPDANLDRAGIALVGEIVRDLVARGRMVAIAAHTDELASIPGTRLTLT